MNERKDAVTMKGNPLTLLGTMPQVGQKAPDFTVTANDLSEKTLADYTGKVLILSAVPSLDTPTCDRETRRFNEESAKLPNVTVLTISMDLPFAQKRWCGAAGIENIETLSDYRNASFGENYGVLIKDLRLLARAVFVVDRDGTVQYVQLVPEIADEPDYKPILAKAAELAK